MLTDEIELNLILVVQLKNTLDEVVEVEMYVDVVEHDDDEMVEFVQI